MNHNINSGYGQALATALHGNVPVTGKLRIVGDSSTANLDMIKEMFVPDADGEIRFYATLDAAVSDCTANAGDVIAVAPGHAEAVTATSIDIDIAGLTIINMGHGGDAPTYTFGAAAATITVDAANVKWIGGKFIANFDNVAAAFTVGTAAADDFSLEGGLFVDNSAALHFLSCVVTTTTDGNADGLKIVGNTWHALALAPNAFISILGDISRLHVEDNFVDMAATNDVGHFITFAAKDSLASRIKNNVCIVVGATGALVGIFLTGSGTAHTGIVEGNKVASLDTTTELIATAGTGLQYFENYYTGNIDTSGKLWPVVDAA
jgi:hypothetical protein